MEDNFWGWMGSKKFQKVFFLLVKISIFEVREGILKSTPSQTPHPPPPQKTSCLEPILILSKLFLKGKTFFENDCRRMVIKKKAIGAKTVFSGKVQK